jgi:hypothetical protein
LQWLEGFGRVLVRVLLQVREAKVRRAGIGGRARLAGELRDMDDEVWSHCRARQPF